MGETRYGRMGDLGPEGRTRRVQYRCGAAVKAAGPVSSPCRYAGAAYDVGPGLTYDRARYYDASMGRFLSKDSAGGGYARVRDAVANLRLNGVRRSRLSSGRRSLQV